MSGIPTTTMATIHRASSSTAVISTAFEYGATYWERNPSFRIVNVRIVKAMKHARYAGCEERGMTNTFVVSI